MKNNKIKIILLLMCGFIFIISNILINKPATKVNTTINSSSDIIPIKKLCTSSNTSTSNISLSRLNDSSNISDNSSLNDSSNISDNSSDNIEKMKKMVKSYHKNLHVTSSKLQYIKIEKTFDDDGREKFVSKSYTKDEYINEKNKENYNNTISPVSFSSKPRISYSKLSVSDKSQPIINRLSSSTTKSYSWIELELDVCSYGNGTYLIDGYYSWLTSPLFSGTDFITLSHDSNLTFNYSNTYADCLDDVFNNYGGYSTDEDLMHSDNTNCTAQTYGIGYKFPISHADVHIEHGVIEVQGVMANRNGLTSNVVFSYEHQTVVALWSASVSFPAGVGLCISPSYCYTRADLGTQIWF